MKKGSDQTVVDQDHLPSQEVDQEATSEIINETSETSEELTQLQRDLAQAKDSVLRSQADYQNLIRRTQEDRTKLVKMATRDLVEDLLQPLDHLSLASAELKDKGLDMVVAQLWRTLNNHGLEEIQVMDQPFNHQTMEVVDKKGDGDMVQSVIRKGYRLHGEVIQHAKVIVG